MSKGSSLPAGSLAQAQHIAMGQLPSAQIPAAPATAPATPVNAPASSKSGDQWNEVDTKYLLDNRLPDNERPHKEIGLYLGRTNQACRLRLLDFRQACGISVKAPVTAAQQARAWSKLDKRERELAEDYKEKWFAQKDAEATTPSSKTSHKRKQTSEPDNDDETAAPKKKPRKKLSSRKPKVEKSDEAEEIEAAKILMSMVNSGSSMVTPKPKPKLKPETDEPGPEYYNAKYGEDFAKYYIKDVHKTAEATPAHVAITTRVSK